ncbi:tRNA 5-methoxyuridine(34)/uridine 5-oxyacetic acid(34) synthase CmoB [Ferrimonas balearica]|uniref:tRNA 5-methoxyuridine(34)/uridine 5-oxyacetic acid(34) synthase CmoB n=1 Tax=Ferrimonas balearica TaxID=44012 RepID=UPI001C59F8BA|nr:tRNA 5-methoxyuridine(34)/uridine 5-oxyacetic acid(34) synthase CmoB [Ferrimonas balearica]MBW3163285.1 tRNA 5-methoxyuridine(34)/uridine 5-oxyacetic acid(34) synthase CmoB [Ferrimonas balearica]MBY6106185.1 tRNA 5-methoxyuridine(34)/uridine 5-oxyacetic acid(34) synthase CmoB [Ferrimonas balearica]MBY6223234.1 tRNA 5-methoxyuridine(34)/uridine 5-oxyacetic acid(34) synthase CmoB [Ferrimonas balearica]
MMDFARFYQRIAGSKLSHWLETAPAQLSQWRRFHRNGQFPKWEKVLAKLPDRTPALRELSSEVRIGSADELSSGEVDKVNNLLRCLHPWRKGPFHLYGIHIDTEWRSDWKWDRVKPHISPLKHRTVLDVGCGSGYHMWRMLGEGADLVVGIDPSDLFLAQFEAVKKLYGGHDDIHLLPLGIQDLPPLHAFDTVFSMGVLYHRRSPIDHLLQLQDQLNAGGELILETLVIDGDENQVLVPTDRYGKMNNVWYIPSSKALMLWLRKCGFENVRLVDEAITTVEEQRRTDWMTNESLADYLDPNDPSRTVEGYPAPKRAIIIANKASNTG